jgi:hypothetical protein
LKHIQWRFCNFVETPKAYETKFINVFWLLMELWINDQPNGCHVQKKVKGY